MNNFERGALYGLRASLAGFLDDRSSEPRLMLRSSHSEDIELIDAAHHISAAIRAIRRLEARLAELDEEI